MSTLNKAILIGHVGGEMQVHTFDNGNKLGRFSMATNESYTRKDNNEKVTETQWHNIVVRNKTVDILEKYLKKGDKLYVDGKIKTRKWTDQNGVDRYSTEIHCFEFKFLTPKGQSGNETQPQQQAQSQQNSNSDTLVPDDNDDLPF